MDKCVDTLKKNVLCDLELGLPERELLLQLGGFNLIGKAVIDDALLKLLKVSSNLGHKKSPDLLLRRLQSQGVDDPQVNVVGHIGIYK